jgi:retron-type reverse transcriptase
VLMLIYEPKFSEGSFGYRPNRIEKDAIAKV